MSRIIVIGGVAAGASAAAKARRMNEGAEIVMVEAGPYISFANCGLPYYVGGEIAAREALFVTDAESFAQRFRVDVRLETRCQQVDRAQRKVALDGPTGSTVLSYDRLVLATGTVPFIPPVRGIDGPSMFSCRTVPDVDKIMQRMVELLPHEMEGEQAQALQDSRLRALVIGGGYIGLECAEQLMRRGFEVTVVELAPQLMTPLDAEMTFPIRSAIERAGGQVILGDAVSAIDPVEDRWAAKLSSGAVVTFDIGIVGAGVRPDTRLASEAGLAIGPSGAIQVDAQQRTSDPMIFAAGDNSESIYLPTGTPRSVPLAGPANKQGRVAGANAALDLLDVPRDDSSRLSFRGVLGTGIVRVCGVVAGGTGLTEKLAAQLGLQAATAYVWGPSHAGYYPGAQQMLLKLLYEPDNGRLLGAQVVGGEGADKRLDVLATAIYAGLSVEDLSQLDLAYAPPFGSAKDATILAGFIASNARAGVSPALSPAALVEELASGQPPVVIDVRSTREHRVGHIDGSCSIPLEQLRERLQDIPRDRAIVVHCGVGYRSYVAQRILLNSGFDNVRNLHGGYALYCQLRRQRACD